MRPWTTAIPRGAALVLLGSAVGACGSGPPSSGTGVSSVVPIALQPASQPPLRLIVGDTYRLVYRGGGAPRIALTAGADSAAANFASSAANVATVSNGGLLTAQSVGTTVISATPTLSPQVAPSMLTVVVVTARQAANLMALDVCPNADSLTLAAAQPLPATVFPVHEYHDCQRLIANGAYQAPVGIFAHENVATLQRWEDWEQGRLAAIIVNIAVKQERLPYPWLGIKPGTNCLVLKADSPHDWRAAVISRNDVNDPATGAQQYSACDETLTWANVAATDSVLVVKRQKGIDMKGDSIAPPVARWDWDSTNARNYIGVKCDSTTWCDIGPRDFHASRPLTITRWKWWWWPWPLQTDSVLKGYYDQQFLANVTGRQPSTVFGTISPGEDARELGQMDPAGNDWYEVAVLEFRETATQFGSEYARYVREYKTKGGGPPSARTTTTRYRLRPTGTGVHHELYEGDLNKNKLGARGVLSRPHPGHLHGGPPVVRWRWDEKDERTWTYCDPEGCCENMKVLQELQ